MLVEKNICHSWHAQNVDASPTNFTLREDAELRKTESRQISAHHHHHRPYTLQPYLTPLARYHTHSPVFRSSRLGRNDGA